jgi:glycosyltransferase involved in cell wall biosynthesis
VPARSSRRTLHVGLDLVFLGERAGGVGRYACELLPALLESEPQLRLTCFVGSTVSPALLDESWAAEVRWVRFPVAATSRAHLFAQFAAMPALAAARKIDVLHSVANVGPWVTPRVARVLTLHDLLFLTQGADWNPHLKARRVTAALALRSARRADRVIAVSEFTARRLVGLGEIDAASIDVVPSGAPEMSRAVPSALSEVRARWGIGNAPFVLCVAQKRRYKNQLALVRALVRLAPPLKLVLPGAPTPYEDELREEAQRLGVADRVCLIDWVSEADLEALYAAASCVALPSLEEGFGLPVLEAMVRGVPVVCSAGGAMAEVANGAAVLIDPSDVGAVAGAVERVLRDPTLAADLVRRGRRRAAMFTWRRAADQTLAVYRRALAERCTSRL